MQQNIGEASSQLPPFLGPHLPEAWPGMPADGVKTICCPERLGGLGSRIHTCCRRLPVSICVEPCLFITCVVGHAVPSAAVSSTGPRLGHSAHWFDIAFSSKATRG